MCLGGIVTDGMVDDFLPRKAGGECAAGLRIEFHLLKEEPLQCGRNGFGRRLVHEKAAEAILDRLHGTGEPGREYRDPAGVGFKVRDTESFVAGRADRGP